MQAEKQDIEKLLMEGKNVRLKPQGYSMYPVLVPGRDEVIIEPVEGRQLKRGDVVLYRREKKAGGILVLHRIWKYTEAGVYFVGDNQTEIEGPLQRKQIKGIMAGMVRRGKYISVKNPLYLVLTWMWLMLRPLRPVISKGMAGLKKIGKRVI